MIGWLRWAYARLMSLYPPGYRREFAVERQDVFEQALQNAVARGSRALLRLALREGRDMPASIFRANLEEMGIWMKKISSNLDQERNSWIGLLAGLWPFIFLGPVMALVPYLPSHVTNVFDYDKPLWLATVFLTILIGLAVAWARGFPRWSYPYLVFLFFAVLIPTMAKLSILLGSSRFDPLLASALLLTGILGLGALFIWLIRLTPPLRKIYYDVRADWTRLSFGLYIYMAFATSFYGGDHRPPLSLAVVLPTLLILMGAVVYLLCKPRWARILALVVGVLLALLVKLLQAPGEGAISLIALFLIALIFLPALVELLPPSKGPLQSDPSLMG
jgi:hypothetical protein